MEQTTITTWPNSHGKKIYFRENSNFCKTMAKKFQKIITNGTPLFKVFPMEIG
jgi:hypothetical protein